MSKKIGRPVEFDAAKQEIFCALVEVGVSRRQAAEHVGIAPSTATRRARRDDAFADALRKAEMKFHVDLMEKLRRQSERSWRACVWLLEHTYPEIYGRGKVRNRPGLTVDQLFDQFVTLLEEIPDEGLRNRLTERLDRLAAQEFESDEAAEAENAEDEVAVPEVEVAAVKAVAAISPADAVTPAETVGMPIETEPAAAKTHGGAKSQRSETPGDSPAQRRADRQQPHQEPSRVQAAPVSRKPSLVDELLAAAGVSRQGDDFCNTSP